MHRVKLGDHVFPVVAQRHTRFREATLGEDLQAVFAGLQGGTYAEPAYRLLSFLIPAITRGVSHPDGTGYEVEPMPFWEFDGYASCEAMEAGEYDEALDRAPATDEIVNALEVALFQASGAQRLGALLDTVRDVQKLGDAAPPTQATSALAATPTTPVSPGSTGE